MKAALKIKNIFCGGLLPILVTTFLVCSASAAEPFFFVHLSDTQFGMFTSNKNFEQETANCEFAVATINRLKPAFVVITGDLINKAGDAGQIAEFKRIFGKVDKSIPIHNVVGNHDVENVPTPETIAAYTREFGPDHYTFRHGDFLGIVIDSNLIKAPEKTQELAAEQENWLKGELEKAKNGNVRHIVLFEHHPWFVETATETNQYFNLPLESRQKYLTLFHENGVKQIFCGHCHHNVFASDGDLEIVAAAPVGKPLGKDGSGMMIVKVWDDHIEHQYYDFGKIPNKVTLAKSAKPVTTAR